ncbi:MAG: transcriptional regulator NrdR [Candidatus Dojkabacteria bacterium]
MHCPYCGSSKLKVIDKRDNEDTNTVRRRRECIDCEKRFTTYERVEKVLLSVIKRDGKIQEFDRNKIKTGILKAVKKRNIPENKIEKLIDNIEQQLMSSDKQMIRSVDIGDMVLRELTRVDKLGALLFAAVYNEFETLEDVQKQLRELAD